MRVLAHPTRLRLLTELRLHGPLTVGALGDLVDEAPGTVSYHLGRLAEHDLVVEAPELAKDRRERWWRSAHRTTSWDPNQGRTDPELRMASDALRRQVFRSYAESLEQYLQIEPVLDPAWTQGVASSDALLELTADELTELRQELVELAQRWQQRSDGAGERSGRRQVSLIQHAFRREV